MLEKYAGLKHTKMNKKNIFCLVEGKKEEIILYSKKV